MRNLFFTVTGCFLLSFCVAQTKTQWLKGNLVKLDPDKVPDDPAQIKQLKKSIGNAQIVLLGEQSHGDATTFEMKTQFVKFLHQHMGFKILAFESNLYEAEAAWKKLKDSTNKIGVLRKAIYPVWSDAIELQPLFEYIAASSQTKKPLQMTGFDCQFLSLYQNPLLKKDFINYINSKKIGFKNDAEQFFFFEMYNNLVNSRAYFSKATNDTEKQILKDSLKNKIPWFINILNKKILQLSTINERQAQLFAQFWKNTRDYLPDTIYWIRLDKSIPLNKNLRDSLMAENLIWLAEKYYPGQKIIVWAASYHLAKHKTIGYGNLIETLMGDYLRKNLDKKTYTITFTAYQGNVGRYYSKDSSVISPPGENSFEVLFNETGVENFFLDLKTNSKTNEGTWLNEVREMRPLGYVRQEKSWPLVFDAVIFTRNMRRVHPMKK